MTVCNTRQHDWEGEYRDGWLFISCTKCKAKNIEYHLSKKEAKLIYKGWWDVNDLHIEVYRSGKLKPKSHWYSFTYEGWQEEEKLMDEFSKSLYNSEYE